MEKNKKILNRELSWLAFNYRVLQEAQDITVPLLERIQFMAIFSSNLDEYFKVRVATLKRLIQLKKGTRQQLTQDPSEELDQVLAEVTRQQEELGKTFRNQIMPALHAEHIYILDEETIPADQETFVQDYFAQKVQPLLAPVVLTPDLNFFFLKDQVLYLLVELTHPGQPPITAILEVPTKQHGGRFVKLPTRNKEQFVLFLDDLIRFNLRRLFPEYRGARAYAIKISRDAELDMEEEVSENVMAKIQRSLKKRETGYPSRLLYDSNMPQPLQAAVCRLVGVTPEELLAGSRYHNFRDFFGFPDFNLPKLKYPPQPPLPQPQLQGRKNLFKVIYRQDFLLHYPYQSFDYVLQFLNKAAKDPAVTTISATLYRVADKSKVAKALVKAAKNGKRVTVVVELQARFDEESNIYWARKLQKAGATVIAGLPGYKVHGKLCLVTRQEKNKPVQYAYLSTGNFNEKTSRIYGDHGLFTSDARITKEVEQIFQFLLDRNPENKQFRHLLVAPFNMRPKFMQLINQEIRNAKKGLPAYLIAKMNSLQDEAMILKLYEASAAGVQIDLIVRGICCLNPGIKNLRENITVRSIVDRYLEHARVFIFGNNNDEKMYVASADWMTRNLSRRVEVGFPIFDKALHQEIRHLIDLQLQDNTKARTIDNQYVHTEASPASRAQYATYDYLQHLKDEVKVEPETH
ncbi:polyphosphate kinase 1 [Adhaeribacter pallidiroseus]|uniref:Polyphosphate kinase n=1 Tax=Adhaeribacter pallidiroseus TaxID=2072847 RepID=A0A369QJM6_9BACT|nr:polyphosphate kinase 1 [Adhaeribacter pallidiroseus]RDC64592.1 Polyphosphate kinase [Adhaeribacter pallidiroseus]